MKQKSSEGILGQDWKLLTKLFQATNVRARRFVVPVLLSGAAAFFEGVTIAVLVPLIKGALEQDFSFLSHHTGFEAALKILSGSQGDVSRKTIFAVLISVIFLSAVLKNLFQYLSGVILDSQIFEFLGNLRKLLFSRCLMFGKSFFDQASLGGLLNVVLNSALEVVIAVKVAHRYFSSLLMLLPYLLLMLWISWQMTVVSILLFPLFYFGVNLSIGKIRESSRSASHFQTELGRHTSNVLMNVGLVKACRTEQEEIKKFTELSFATSQSRLRVENKQGLIPVIHEMATLLAFLILVSAMTFMIRYGGSQDVSQLLVFLVVLRRTLTSVGSFMHLKAQFSRMGGPLLEIDSFLSDEGKVFESSGKEIINGITEGIKFKNVSYSYRDGTLALNQLTLSFEKGKTTAIVGASGAGKTSLVHLLLRYYEPKTGSITVDERDIASLTLDSLRTLFSFVSQETFLFNESIQYNLLYGIKREVSQLELLDALKKARLSEFIKSLPEGLNTLVGDRGIQLSGGEKQRVSIARSILKNAPVMIFDEATSALDSVTEKEVQAAIEDASEGRTCIVIAHRLSTIKRADKIIVLEKGMLAEQGTFEELIFKKSRFFAFWTEQSSAAN